MDELTFSPAATLAQLIRDKTVSSVEVVEAHLARIEQVNPALNALVQVLAESASNRAEEADAATSRGESWGPLHGVPATTKETIAMEGVPSTGGTKGRSGYIPGRDATVITRLRRAGAIMLGNTNVPELVLAGESDNLIYGRTNNPYDLSRTPGGSSGGEAAAISAGASPLGLGSDLGGSLRMPAHFCGIAAIKPTTGRVPATGHWPLLNGLFGPMFQIGPMARSVEDLALVLPLLSGIDGHDPYTVPAGYVTTGDVRDLRVAVFTDGGGVTPDDDTQNAVKAAVEALRDAGASLTEARPPGFEDGHDLEVDVIHADGGSTVRRFLEEAGTTETHPLIHWLEEDEVAPLSGADYAALLAKRDSWRSEMLSFMEGYDGVVSPTWATPAALHGTVSEDWPWVSFTHQYNLSGWPAAVVRAGSSSEGLPIGVQIAARPWREDIALALALCIEEASGGWKPPAL